MPTIGAVIIGQHEEVMLPRCLESLKELDEIAFTYTGDVSQPDGTLDIVKKYTDNINYFRWCDSFCKARNAAKSFAKSDWLLSIDCDEWLEDVSKVREAVAWAEQEGALAVDTLQIAKSDGQKFRFPRLFRNVSQIYWEGNIHNTLSVTGDKIGDVIINVDYSPAHKDDPERAYRILTKEMEEARQEHKPFSPRSMYYLGREYFYRGDWQKCTEMMGRYVQASYFADEKADAFLIMARAFWEMKLPEDAKDAVLQSIKINPQFGEAADFMADLVRKDINNPRRQKDVEQWERMASAATNENILFHRKRDR